MPYRLDKINPIKSAMVLVTSVGALLSPAAARAALTCNFLPDALCNTTDPYAVMSAIANWLVGIFGSVFVLMIVIAGVQMASASDNPDRLKASKKRITNAVVSLVLLISMRAILALLGVSM